MDGGGSGSEKQWGILSLWYLRAGSSKTEFILYILYKMSKRCAISRAVPNVLKLCSLPWYLNSKISNQIFVYIYIYIVFPWWWGGGVETEAAKAARESESQCRCLLLLHDFFIIKDIFSFISSEESLRWSQVFKHLLGFSKIVGAFFRTAHTQLCD